MKIGIVGTSNLTDEEKEKASVIIETIITRAKRNGDTIVTGDADGIDFLVSQISKNLSVNVVTCIAKVKEWNKPEGFKERNKKIAVESGFVYSISTKIKREDCYHCDMQNHERTGGCYVLRLARDMGKSGEVVIIR